MRDEHKIKRISRKAVHLTHLPGALLRPVSGGTPACFAEVGFGVGTETYQGGRATFYLDRTLDDISLGLEFQGVNVYPEKDQTYANPIGRAVLSITPQQARAMAAVLEGYAQALERDYDRLLQERNERVAAIDAAENSA